MKYTPVGVDIAKHVIQIHFINEHTGEVIDKQLRRQDFLTFFGNREPCLIGMEACGGSQHWARELTKLGHKVRLLQARFVKAFVMGNKNDVMDARAIWMAVQQPGKEIAVKILWADRDGLCLFAKRLERGRFVWPVIREGKVHLTPAQLSMLLEGIAWQHPKRTERPGIRI